MSERKAINKWYPPDFDPSKVKKVKKRKKKGQAAWPTVRLMVPFSMKCLKCNEYIPQSRKFNARKETTAQDYLGIKIYRFHVKCPRCFNDLVFSTDPKTGDFLCISGCKPNYERKKVVGREETTEEMIARLEEEDRQEQLAKEREKHPGVTEGETGLEQLEKRLKQQQAEQEMLDEIDELQEKNRRLRGLARQRDEEVEVDADAREAKEAFAKQQKSLVEGYDSTEESSESESDDDQHEPARLVGVKKKVKVTI